MVLCPLTKATEFTNRDELYFTTMNLEVVWGQNAITCQHSLVIIIGFTNYDFAAGFSRTWGVSMCEAGDMAGTCLEK